MQKNLPVFAIFQVIAKLRCVREAFVDGWQRSIAAPCSRLALLLLFFHHVLLKSKFALFLWESWGRIYEHCCPGCV